MRSRFRRASNCSSEQSVFLAPDLFDPSLESIAGRPGLGDLGGIKLRRDIELPRADGDRLHLSSEEVPQRDVAAGIADGDVDHRVELIAETRDDKRDGSDARPQQMLIRRI